MLYKFMYFLQYPPIGETIISKHYTEPPVNLSLRDTTYKHTQKKELPSSRGRLLTESNVVKILKPNEKLIYYLIFNLSYLK